MALRNPRQDPRRARLEQLSALHVQSMKRPVSPEPIQAPGKTPIKPPVTPVQEETTEASQKKTKKVD